MRNTIPALALLLAACGGGGEDTAVSSDPAPVTAPAPVAAPVSAAPVAAPVATAPIAAPVSAPVGSAPASPPATQPPAAQPPAAQPPVSRLPAPIAAPDPIGVHTLACRGTPYDAQRTVWYQVTIEVNYANLPWKWLKQVTPTPQEFMTDPDGAWAAANPNPPNFVLIGSGNVRTASYTFDNLGLNGISISNGGGKNDFPTICSRD